MTQIFCNLKPDFLRKQTEIQFTAIQTAAANAEWKRSWGLPLVEGTIPVLLNSYINTIRLPDWFSPPEPRKPKQGTPLCRLDHSVQPQWPRFLLSLALGCNWRRLWKLSHRLVLQDPFLSLKGIKPSCCSRGISVDHAILLCSVVGLSLLFIFHCAWLKIAGFNVSGNIRPACRCRTLYFHCGHMQKLVLYFLLLDMFLFFGWISLSLDPLMHSLNFHTKELGFANDLGEGGVWFLIFWFSENKKIWM